MNLRDLGYFETIAAEQHIGRAAIKLGRTQPALSKCIKRLEEDFGAALFERSGRGIRLTDVGRKLLEHTVSLKHSVDQSRRDVSDYAKGILGSLRVGSAATAAEYLLPAACARMVSSAPQVRFDLMIGMNEVLRAALSEERLDMVIGPLSDGDEHRFKVRVIAEDTVVVAAANGHSLTKGPVELADLVSHSWALPARSVATRQWLDAAFSAAGLPEPRVQIQTNVISLSPRLVAQTDLLTFISRRNLGAGRAGAPLREVPLPQTTMRRVFGIVYKKFLSLPPAAEIFSEILCETGAKDEAW